jgi:hypothetical protein
MHVNAKQINKNENQQIFQPHSSMHLSVDAPFITNNMGCDGSIGAASTCGQKVDFTSNELPSIYIMGQEYPAPYRELNEYQQGKQNKNIKIKK